MDLIKASILPGFMELLPDDQIVFNTIKNKIIKTFEDHAFKAIETPVIEKKEILLAKGGGETSKQVYSIDHESRDMALRFDLTVPLARYVAQHYHELDFPFRRYHVSKVYRGERNQKGRYKEFYQCDIDIIGDKELNIHNDAEIPYIMYKAFEAINVEGLVININNRKLLTGYFNYLGIDNRVDILRLIDKKDKMDIDKFKSLLEEELADSNKYERLLEFITIDGSNEEILDKLKGLKVDNEEFVIGLDELDTVYTYMKLFGMDDESIKINLYITRGLDYYTGMVYESFIKGHENLGSVCSGGRYDDLASNYTKQKLPGVGMSIGLTRLYFILSQAGLIDIKARPYCELLIIPMEGALEYSMGLLNQLRSSGIRSQIYFEKNKMGKIFSYADKENIPYVAIIGEEEMKENKISLKNMKTGHQEAISRDEIKTIREKI